MRLQCYGCKPILRRRSGGSRMSVQAPVPEPSGTAPVALVRTSIAPLNPEQTSLPHAQTCRETHRQLFPHNFHPTTAAACRAPSELLRYSRTRPAADNTTARGDIFSCCIIIQPARDAPSCIPNREVARGGRDIPSSRRLQHRPLRAPAVGTAHGSWRRHGPRGRRNRPV